MSWNPSKAEEILATNPLVELLGKTDKILAYKFDSSRELALSIQNKTKVSVNVSAYPENLPGIVLSATYPPTKEKEGRHSNLESLTKTLGYENKAYMLEVQSMESMNKLLHWYQYA
jgi:hypothetical protein